MLEIHLEARGAVLLASTTFRNTGRGPDRATETENGPGLSAGEKRTGENPGWYGMVVPVVAK